MPNQTTVHLVIVDRDEEDVRFEIDELLQNLGWSVMYYRTDTRPMTEQEITAAVQLGALPDIDWTE